MKASRSRFLEVRGLCLHLREWGTAGAPRLYLLHGCPADAALRQRLGIDAAARACFRALTVATLERCGHNLHHDQPERLAGIVEPFLLSD